MRKKQLSPATSNDLREHLIRSLQVVQENVKAEAINQPLLFIEVARYRVSKMRARSRAKAELEGWMAQASLRVRAKLQQQGSKDRITNDLIASLVQKDPQYRELQYKLSESEAREEFSKLLLEAYRMRRDAVKILADAEGYEAAKQTVEIERENQNRRLSNEARKLYGHRGSVRDAE